MRKNAKKLTALVSALVLASVVAVPVAGAASTAVSLGDINLDGSVTQADADLLRKALWGQARLTGVQRVAADITKDKHINNDDYTALSKIISGEAETSSVFVDADESGNVKYSLNDNANLAVNSTEWSASLTNLATRTAVQAAAWGMDVKAMDSSMSLNPYGVSIKDGVSNLYYSKNSVSARTNFADGSFSTYLSPAGALYDQDSYLMTDSSPIVRKAANFFANTNINDEVFDVTDYSDGGTLKLLYGDVTRNGDTFTFNNNLSNGTVQTILSRHDAEIDGVKFHYENGEYTYEGIDEADVVMKTVGTRYCDTYEGEHYVEFALYTKDYIYGVMYEPVYDMMAALVRYDYKTNEAALVQYVSSVDFTVLSTFHPQDWVLDYVTEHPENTVEYFDNFYDEDHLVFETAMYRQKMKVVQIGHMDDGYKIYDGLTFTQLPTGVNTIVKNHAGKTDTLMFGQGIFNFSNNAGGVFNTGNIYQYTASTDTFTVVSTDGSLYSPYAPITYAGANGDKAVFTASTLLNMRTPTMY